MPIGTAVSTARKKAPKTRAKLQPKCSSSVVPPWSSPRLEATNAFQTASGDGNTSGGSQCNCVASHQSANSRQTVTTEMVVVLPSPNKVTLALLFLPAARPVAGGSAAIAGLAADAPFTVALVSTVRDFRAPSVIVGRFPSGASCGSGR